MTYGLTTVAGIPGGAGVASKPPVERGEAKKPDPAPERSWWDYIHDQNGEDLPTVEFKVGDEVRRFRVFKTYTIPANTTISHRPMSDYFKEQLDAPALNNPHPLGEEKFLAWGWDAAKKVAEQTFRKEQQEACLDWPALNYCDSCQTCAHCLKNGCLPVKGE